MHERSRMMPAAAAATMMKIGFAEAEDRLSAFTATANATGEPFVITKNNKPWVEMRPLAGPQRRDGAVSISPIRRMVSGCR